MKFIEAAQVQKDAYNLFVTGHNSGSFLQSWEWGQWQEVLGKKVFRFMVEDDSGVLSMAVQLITMPLFGNQYYLYAPYGPVVHEEVLPSAVVKFLLGNLYERFPEALFLRVEPQRKIDRLEDFAKKTVNIQPGITMVVDVSKSNEDLLAAMHPKTRYNIKIAERHGVEIKSERVHDGILVQQAIALIIQTQHRQKYRGHDSAYYQKLLKFFAAQIEKSDLHITVYTASVLQEVIVSAVMVDYGKIRMYLYGGSSDSHRNAMAPYLLHWQAMQDARALGIAVYDLGGSEVASGGERGFTRFKRGFGGTVVEFTGAYDIVYHKLWYTIYTSGRILNRLIQKLK